MTQNSSQSAVSILNAGGPPLVMGVVNVTPDSFSDGGSFFNAETACAHGLSLAEAGAAILDVGGESTRPGSDPVPEAEEMDRVLPVIEALASQTEAIISIDSMKPAVARAAVAAGASVWNDVSALQFAPDALATAADLGVPLILMHMQGAPKTMQADPSYTDVVVEVSQFLNQRCAAAEAAGVARDHLIVDPGVGFGKTLDHNLALMRALPQIMASTGRPILFGASRKRFIHALDPSASDAQDRLGGSLAAALWAAQAGARIVRVHDVRQTVQALTVWRAMAGLSE